MKTITLQDISRLSLQNQYSIPIADIAKLTDPNINGKRIHYILGVVAAAAWNITGISNNADPDLREITISGTGNVEFHHIRCFDTITGATGITEIHGFWSNAGNF